jgi:predicted Zn-dependent peptidase
MKQINFTLIFFVMLASAMQAQVKYKFTTHPDDPLKSRIYTLSNGLTVHLAVNKDEPRIQTYIGVRAGSKDDPAETTGLAHYFEHMMFKGTPNFGTMDWEKEKLLIAQIEAKFETYRMTKDPQKRKEIYKEIDQLSFEASKLAIPNEYDKLMTSIGSNGTNAFTSNDYTAYVENIPSNQVENWAMIQAERFTTPVLRIFHTELETVYEEKNMSLTNDGRRANEATMMALFPNHPYGTQTTLGEAEHLKNPSMVEINKFFKKYYVPNNMVVVMAGDFDPDKTIAIIDKHLGKLKRGVVPAFTAKPLLPLNGVKTVEITGQEAENVSVSFRMPKIGTRESMVASLMSMVLTNGKAGLIDLNINQKQLALGAGSFVRTMVDHSMFTMSGRPKSGQKLEELKDLLIGQLELLKKGEFEDWILTAAVNNMKLQEVRRYENNNGIAQSLLFSYLNRVPWEYTVNYNKNLSTITKKEIVDFANKYCNGDYVITYKRQGKPTDIPIVEKPAITPVHINRDVKSDFLKNVEATKVMDIQPQFVDYDKQLGKSKTPNGLDVLYSKNETNDLFTLSYYFPLGTDHDKMINLASNYLSYLGTSKLTPEQINQEFYKLACNFSVQAGREETQITLTGLKENQGKAIQLLEDLLTDAQVNTKAWENLIKDVLKSRADAKKSQQSNFNALTSYALYGGDSPVKNIVSEQEMKALNPQVLVDLIRDMSAYKHDVLYYGPSSVSEIADLVGKVHKVPSQFKAIPQAKMFKVAETPENKVIFAHYEGPQSQVQTIIKGSAFDNDLLPKVNVFNDYFGGGMNAIVFQELREKRGLAYSAWSRYLAPTNPDENFRNLSFIATQNDKVVEALNAFNDLFDNMPKSETAYNLSKESMMKSIATQRVSKMNVIMSYLNDRKMKRDFNMSKKMYEVLPTVSLNDVAQFNESYIKGKSKTYVILGNEKLLNFDDLAKRFGPVTKLKQEEYFGY